MDTWARSQVDAEFPKVDASVQPLGHVDLPEAKYLTVGALANEDEAIVKCKTNNTFRVQIVWVSKKDTITDWQWYKFIIFLSNKKETFI